MDKFNAMGKEELRAACRETGISYGKLNNDGMRAALRAKAEPVEAVPVVEVFKVDHITYSEHRKEGRPPMMKASYYCGYRVFDEFVCIEHTNYAGKKARDWWRMRSSEAVPSSTAEALECVDRLRTPTHLRVWINKKYPEILAVCLDGTAFGTQEPHDLEPGPTIQSYAIQSYA